MKSLAIGSDHAGFILKGKIIAYLQSKGYSIDDKGCYSEDSVDYPDFAHAVSKSVESNEVDLGILLCGSGNGISMAANKHAGIRAALSWIPEIAALARQHNNANILSIPARYVSDAQAFEIVDSFLNTEFEGGRHERRVQKITCQ